MSKRPTLYLLKTFCAFDAALSSLVMLHCRRLGHSDFARHDVPGIAYDHLAVSPSRYNSTFAVCVFITRMHGKAKPISRE